MKNRIHFLHHSPGRIRIEIDGLKGNWKLVEAIQALTDKLPGVTRITVSAVTGSVLICYDRSDPDVLGRLESMASDAEALLDCALADSSSHAARLGGRGTTR